MFLFWKRNRRFVTGGFGCCRLLFKNPYGRFTESLNISVSAAIILQDVTNKLRQSDVKWQLSEQEQLEKRLDWISKTLKSYDEIVARYYQSK